MYNISIAFGGVLGLDGDIVHNRQLGLYGLV